MANNSELDVAFKELEEDFGFAKEVRRELIKNLRAEAAKIKFNEFDKATVIMAKVSIVKALDDVLKSDSSLTLDKLKMKLARKDSETNGMVGATIAAMLKNMRVNEGGESQSKDPTEGAMEAIAERAKELAANGDDKIKKALSISDGETQECGGLPNTGGTAAPKLKPLKSDDDEEEE